MNYPQWNIYSSDINISNIAKANSDVKPEKRTLTPQNADTVAKEMEKDLYLSCKDIYREQNVNKLLLWETASLCDDKYSFSISERIAYCKISYETACGMMSGEPDKMSRLPRKNDEIYLILIPDASMMKVHKCIIVGIRAVILDLLSKKQRVSLNDMAEYLSKYHGIRVASEEKKALDSSIRAMLVSNILTFAQDEKVSGNPPA